MTTAAEYAALAEASANEAGTHAINVQNKVAVAESSANLATTHANTVGASVDAAEASNTNAALQAIESENYRDLAQLWANADANVVVEGTAYSARHQALSTIATLAAMQASLNVTAANYAADKAVSDAAIVYLGNRLDTGNLVFDSSEIDTDISDLNTTITNQLTNKLGVALYNTDTLNLADFAKSSSVSLDNKIIDYLDEAGQIALQAMLAGADNKTKLSYAGVVVDPDTGIITNAAGSALATEYGVRVASVEETIDGQGKYTVAVQQQLTDSIATVQQTLETSITGVINGSTSINLHSATVDGTNTIATYVAGETDALVVVNSGTPAQRAALTGMDSNDLFIEATTETSSSGVVIDVSNTYKYNGTAWIKVSNNANTLALADLADGKRSIFSNVSQTLPSGAVVNDLWIPTSGTNNATYIPGDVYQYSGSAWAVATKYSAEITTVNSKYSVKINANGHVAGFGLMSTANNAGTGSGGFSEFVVNADSFKVANSSSSRAPFRVVTGAGMCVESDGTEHGNTSAAACTANYPGGVWVEAGIWMDTTFIGDATIDAAKIRNLQVDELAVNNLIAGYITTTDLTAKYITAEASISAPTITGGSISAGTITGGVIKGSIFIEGASAVPTDAGSSFLCWIEGVTDASSTNVANRTNHAYNRIRTYNNTSNTTPSPHPTTGVVLTDHTTDLFKYRHAVITPAASGNFKFSELFQANNSHNSSLVPFRVNLSIRRDSETGPIIGSANLVPSITRTAGNDTTTITNGGVVFTVTVPVAVWSVKIDDYSSHAMYGVSANSNIAWTASVPSGITYAGGTTTRLYLTCYVHTTRTSSGTGSSVSAVTYHPDVNTVNLSDIAENGS